MGEQGPKTILVVEDEKDIRKIVRISLETIGGFEVDMCASAHEALEVLRGKQPDLIILDVMMPLMDGPTLLTEFRKMELIKDIPVLFMTGKVQAHEIEEYKSMGVLDVIVKPFDPVNLPKLIKEIWCSTETI